MDGDCADTKKPLPQRSGAGDVADPIQKDFIVLDRHKADREEQTVIRQAVTGEAERKTKKALSILPNNIHILVFSHNHSRQKCLLLSNISGLADTLPTG